jgi:membrane protein
MFDRLDISGTVQSLQVSALYYLRGLYREIAAKNLFLWAQAIAFKVLVTIVPIVVLATGLVGRLLQGQDAFAAVARFIHDFLPPSQANELVQFLNQLQNASGAIVGLGGAGLFLSAVSLFITLRIAVGNAFEQDWHESRSIFGGYLFDVRMVVQVGLLFVLTVSLSVVAQSMLSPPFFQSVGLESAWVREGWRQTIRTVSLLLPFLITTVMFFQLYYLVPQPHPRKRSALTGALIAAVLWEAAKQAFTYYATYVGHFDRYGTGAEGLGALGNTFGLIIAFVFWVYFSAIVLMIGAVIASLREHRHVTSGRLPGDEPTATEPIGPAEAGDGKPGRVERPSDDSPPHPAPPVAAPSVADAAAGDAEPGAASDTSAPDEETTSAPESPASESPASESPASATDRPLLSFPRVLSEDDAPEDDA